MSHASVPLFIPHLACKNDCVFCNQKRIAGTISAPSDPYGFFSAALKDIPHRFNEVDLAFFGGSFTGLDAKDMIFYLDAARRIKNENPAVTGIRLSTRPDYINTEILDILKSYGVTTIELGAQSMSDEVLKLSNRGHTSKDTEKATELIKKYGFELVLQFMPGLPGDTEETSIQTAEKIAALKPDAVRIYPCVVIKDTELESAYYDGDFNPLSVEQAVELCAKMVYIFEKSKIKIIRLGLHSSDLVKTQSVVAGPFHPAFGELVSQRIFYLNAEKMFSNNPPTSNSIIYVAPGCISKMVGRKRINIINLNKKFGVMFCVKEKPYLKQYELERGPQ
ncbi:MAG: radical SAM protein [Clostridiales bacterium]|nr:MAG: radical SAM protein [Clostridiales bacterium]